MKDRRENASKLFQMIATSKCFPECKEAEVRVLVFVFSPFYVRSVSFLLLGFQFSFIIIIILPMLVP